MGLFSRKPKVTLDDFCWDAYDTHFLDPHIQGVPLNKTFTETIKNGVVEVDPSFAIVDEQALATELTVIRFEVFALAWLHKQGEKTAVAQSAFTQSYLEGKGRTDIWEGMGRYNKAISNSCFMGMTSETRVGRAYTAFLNTRRANFFDQWCAQGYAPLSIGRVANRLEAETAWKKNLTAGLIMVNLCEAVGRTERVNDEAEFRLTATIRGFYDGALEVMRPVKIKD